MSSVIASLIEEQPTSENTIVSAKNKVIIFFIFHQPPKQILNAKLL
jgi:hypothetical protein